MILSNDIQTRDTCYFCTSSFQILSIISLAIERNEEADLYIDPQFSGAETYAQQIQETGLFQQVEVIKSRDIYSKYLSAGPGLINHLQIAFSYLHVDDIAEMITAPHIRYKNIFVSSKAYLPRMVILYYIKHHFDVSINYFDDGAGTYHNDRAYNIKNNDEKIRRLIFGKDAIRRDYPRYVYAPVIYRELNPNATWDVFPLYRFWEKTEKKNMLNSIFNISTIPEIKEKVIILDEPKGELLSRENSKKLEGVYNIIIQEMGSDNVIIKKHPRNQEPDHPGFHYYKETGIPFEVLCMNMDMNDKMIITYSSTAAVTPKILMEQEPKVIVLRKMFETNTGEKDLFNDYFHAVQNAYRIKKKFLIPLDQSELNEIIRKEA